MGKASISDIRWYVSLLAQLRSEEAPNGQAVPWHPTKTYTDQRPAFSDLGSVVKTKEQGLLRYGLRLLRKRRHLLLIERGKLPCQLHVLF